MAQEVHKAAHAATWLGSETSRLSPAPGGGPFGPRIRLQFARFPHFQLDFRPFSHRFERSEPRGQVVYVLNELLSTVVTCRYESGERLGHNISMYFMLHACLYSQRSTIHFLYMRTYMSYKDRSLTEDIYNYI